MNLKNILANLLIVLTYSGLFIYSNHTTYEAGVRHGEAAQVKVEKENREYTECNLYRQAKDVKGEIQRNDKGEIIYEKVPDRKDCINAAG